MPEKTIDYRKVLQEEEEAGLPERIIQELKEQRKRNNLPERRKQIEEERRKQIEEERRKQIEEERRKQIQEERRKQIEEERRKQIEERRKQIELSDKLDRVIRNSRNFNSIDPLECTINIKDLPYIEAENLFFIANNGRFKVLKIAISLKYLTPMQVSDRLFGKYLCKKCRKEWSSGHSWSNAWQQCNKCDSRIYPFYQRQLESSKKDDLKQRPHDSSRCQKCIELKHICA